MSEKVGRALRLLIAISTSFQNRTGGNETAAGACLVRELTDYLTVQVINSNVVELVSIAQE